MLIKADRVVNYRTSLELFTVKTFTKLFLDIKFFINLYNYVDYRFGLTASSASSESVTTFIS